METDVLVAKPRRLLRGSVKMAEYRAGGFNLLLGKVRVGHNSSES